MSIRIGIGLDVFGAGIDADATTIYNRIIADGGVSNLSRLNFFVKGLKAIYGDLANVPVCYDAHWIGYKLGSGTGATAGQAAAKLYSLTVASDAVQSTAASQPLLLAHNGASSDNYYQGVGVLGNNITTPNASANNITGDIEIIWNITSLNISTISQIVAKFGTSFCYNVYQWTSKRFIFETQYGSVTSTAHTLNSGDNCWFKVTRQSSNGEHKFYQSTDGTNWTLFSTITGTSGNLSIGGSLDIFKSDPQVAKLHRLTISNSIGGTPVVDFNPATYNASTSQTAWTSSTGEIWTINTGTATSGYKGTLVSKTIVMSDGVDDFISVTGMTSRQYFTRYVACIPYTNPNTAPRIISGNADTHLIFKTGAGAFEAFNGTQLAFTGEVVNILQALIVDYNSINSKTFVNNANETSGNTGTTSSTAISLFGSVTGTTLSNAVINTVIQPISVDNSTVRTATYEFLRSLNGSAF